MDIQITIAEKSEQPILENLMQLYLYDFSEICGDDCDEQGRFEYEYLPRYWVEPERHPFLIRVDGKHAGFALVRLRTEAPEDPPPHSVAEFFILRKYRRQGVGEQAAFQIFDRFPGPWEVAEIPENVGAIHFWRRIIDTYTGGNYGEIIDPDWKGPVQRFVSSGSRS
jgi:predicted acetyltransferase